MSDFNAFFDAIASTDNRPRKGPARMAPTPRIWWAVDAQPLGWSAHSGTEPANTTRKALRGAVLHMLRQPDVQIIEIKVVEMPYEGNPYSAPGKVQIVRGEQLQRWIQQAQRTPPEPLQINLSSGPARQTTMFITVEAGASVPQIGDVLTFPIFEGGEPESVVVESVRVHPDTGAMQLRVRPASPRPTPQPLRLQFYTE